MDGGISSNDFVMQLTADLFGLKVARPQQYEMSCLGAAFVAGLEVGRNTQTHTYRVTIYPSKLTVFITTGVRFQASNRIFIIKVTQLSSLFEW